MSKQMKIVSWVLQLTAAIILLQTLFFKFTAAPESVYIFSTLGVEPYGRIGLGVVELIASILLLIPSLAWLGATIGLGIMGGAILSHLAILGIEVQNDGGTLFILALLVFFSCSGILLIRKGQWLPLVAKFVGR